MLDACIVCIPGSCKVHLCSGAHSVQRNQISKHVLDDQGTEERQVACEHTTSQSVQRFNFLSLIFRCSSRRVRLSVIFQSTATQRDVMS